jgi:hypothetical protein
MSTRKTSRSKIKSNFRKKSLKQKKHINEISKLSKHLKTNKDQNNYKNKFEKKKIEYEKLLKQISEYKLNNKVAIAPIGNAKEFAKMGRNASKKKNYMMALQYYLMAIILLSSLNVSNTTRLSEDVDNVLPWYPNKCNPSKFEKMKRFNRKTYREMKKQTNRQTKKNKKKKRKIKGRRKGK